MQFPSILTFLTTLLFASTALAGTAIKRSGSLRHGVASSDVNAHTNKGGNNGQANGNKGLVKGSYHVVQTTEACGNAQLNCCNTVEQEDQEGKGAIGAALGIGGFIAVGCTPVHIRMYNAIAIFIYNEK